MAKTSRIEDKTFGLLNHVAADLWQRPIELNLFGHTLIVPLYVDIPRKGAPEANQIAAYKKFSQNTSAMIESVETEVIGYYSSLHRVKPAIARRAVSVAVTLESVSFPYSRARPTFGFLFRCDWDEEHGLAVKFEDGQITGVGPQDILL